MTRFRILLGASLLALACGGAVDPFEAECPADRLAAIEAARWQESIETCAGKLPEECPELQAIDDKYDAMLEQWRNCGDDR